MGYTHYWYRLKEYPIKQFRKVIDDFLAVLPEIEGLGVKLKGWDGRGEPIINYEEVRFNGDSNCNHNEFKVEYLIEPRICHGDCSHETFAFPRVFNTAYPIKLARYYLDCCKTAYKPYDLAVTTFLVIAKYHFEDDILLTSDGSQHDWMDAINLVDDFLGYGEVMTIEEEIGKIKLLESRESRLFKCIPNKY
jgi:hypothetical protein